MNLHDQDIQRILCIRDDARGDILLTTPAVHALRLAHPKAEIHYLAKRDPAGVLVGNPDITKIHYWENFKTLKAVKFDLVIDWRDRGGPLPCAPCKKVLTAIDDPIMRADIPSRVARHNHGKTFAQLYSAIAGVELSEDCNNVLCIPEELRLSGIRKLANVGINGDQPFIAVSFDSCWKTKEYPATSIQIICDKLAKIHPVVLLGRSNGFRLTTPNTHNLKNQTSIMEAAAIIQAASMFVGIDSLPLHLADTLGTPSVSIWTSTAPETILTNGKLNRSVKTSSACSPCWKTHCNNCRYPSPDEIFNAVEEQMTYMKSGKVYIVMPSYTQTHLTMQSVHSLFEVTERKLIDFHLTLIDDGGDAKHAAVCDTLKKLYPDRMDVIHKENKGFVAATNAGIENVLLNHQPSQDDYILWLNDDVIIQGFDWLLKLAKASQGEHVVGPQGSRLREDFRHAGYVNPGDPTEPHYIDGWCLFAPAWYYQDDYIGLLDKKITEVNPAGTFSEDADWCIRAARLGIERIVVPGIGLKHLHHQTFKAIGKKDPHVPSLKYMREKWGTLEEALRSNPETNPNEKVIIPCCICGDKAEDIQIGEKRGFPIVVCQRCGTQRFGETVSQADTIRHYDKAMAIRERPDWIKNAMRTQEAYWLEFDKYDINFMRKKGRWLDVGTNLGFLLEIVKRNSWDGYGIEISPAFVRKCKQKGLNVVQGAVIDGKVKGLFNMISLLDVIEHDPEPIKMLQSAHKLLHKDGILALSTPDHACPLARKEGIKWDHVRPIEHLWHFTSSNTCRMLEMTGFAMDKMVVTDEWNYPGARLYICRKVRS